MKKKIIVIIQARLTSKRFPNKVISDLSGVTLIERILQRVNKVKKIGKIIIATTKRKDDDILVNIAKLNKVEVFRGSENDLVDRYYQAIKGKNVSHILRLPADNPIPDPREYNRLINYHLIIKLKSGYRSVFHHTYTHKHTYIDNLMHTHTHIYSFTL